MLQFQPLLNYALELIAQEKTTLRYYEFCKLERIEMSIWSVMYKRKMV